MKTSTVKGRFGRSALGRGPRSQKVAIDTSQWAKLCFLEAFGVDKYTASRQLIVFTGKRLRPTVYQLLTGLR